MVPRKSARLSVFVPSSWQVRYKYGAVFDARFSCVLCEAQAKVYPLVGNYFTVCNVHLVEIEVNYHCLLL